ncbi:hypothetical protein EYC84_011044 [Monilinia fructicola]|uniref:Uncharacterized protein n=1 Tax=Monilinia fructicola TaxID=38448 RepID=A0A5M9J946_MONFR|nr:hypothetical protein EYC84_011044 [Monilinia fructicola]
MIPFISIHDSAQFALPTTINRRREHTKKANNQVRSEKKSDIRREGNKREKKHASIHIILCKFTQFLFSPFDTAGFWKIYLSMEFLKLIFFS